MLLVRFLSDGSGFGGLEKRILGFLRLSPVDDRSVFRGRELGRCWSVQLSTVLAGETGEGGEVESDVVVE